MISVTPQFLKYYFVPKNVEINIPNHPFVKRGYFFFENINDNVRILNHA